MRYLIPIIDRLKEITDRKLTAEEMERSKNPAADRQYLGGLRRTEQYSRDEHNITRVVRWEQGGLRYDPDTCEQVPAFSMFLELKRTYNLEGMLERRTTLLRGTKSETSSELAYSPPGTFWPVKLS